MADDGITPPSELEQALQNYQVFLSLISSDGAQTGRTFSIIEHYAGRVPSLLANIARLESEQKLNAWEICAYDVANELRCFTPHASVSLQDTKSLLLALTSLITGGEGYGKLTRRLKSAPEILDTWLCLRALVGRQERVWSEYRCGDDCVVGSCVQLKYSEILTGPTDRSSGVTELREVRWKLE